MCHAMTPIMVGSLWGDSRGFLYLGWSEVAGTVFAGTAEAARCLYGVCLGLLGSPLCVRDVVLAEQGDSRDSMLVVGRTGDAFGHWR